ncbi:MAG: ABC transporter ATP-binding protein [Vicingaceae bacterium]|nr:ABC transporter ATP-binding protein [Vicingaceae bacterium]
MIKLDNISASVGNFALSDINLHLEEGKFHVLLGSTGSGKTLVLELIAGLIFPFKGEVFIQQKETTFIPPELRKIAYLPQDNALFPHKNVFENIAYGLKINKQFTHEIIQLKVAEIANHLAITHLLHRSTKGLSGGEQQRVALARALVMEKKIVLLDEPTSALHESLQEDFCLLLKELHQKFNLTILMTTHHKDSAFLVADYLHFIDNGQLQLSSSINELFNNVLPKNIAKLLGISNFLSLKPTHSDCEYYCKEIESTFRFEYLETNRLDELQIGIKPENIRIIKEEDLHLAHSNQFKVKVNNIYYKESTALVMLQELNTAFIFKMTISIYNQKKLAIEVGKILHCRIKENLIVKVS